MTPPMGTQPTEISSTSTTSSTHTPAPSRPKFKIPPAVWMISLASMLLTFASSIVTTIGPVYLIKIHKINAQDLGNLESVVEFVSQILRFLAGALSDSIFQRKSLMILGFGLSTITKILFPFATSYALFFGVKVLDRIGNGIQASPRDALLGDCAPKEIRGRSYGLSQTLRKFGAGGGALVATFMLHDQIIAFFGYEGSFIAGFFVAIVPAIISLIFLTFFVHPPKHAELKGLNAIKNFFSDFFHNIGRMGKPFWILMIVIWFYGVAHFNESFLQYRAEQLGADAQTQTAIIVVLTLVTSFAAYPLGLVADRIGKKKMVAIGILFMILSNLIMMNFATIVSLFIATAFWGLHWAVTQGLLLSLIVDVAPKHLKGTAFGIYYILFGFASYVANAYVAGPIWHNYSAETNFVFSSIIATIAIIILSIASKLKMFPKVHD
jgi:MFS family permease